MPFETMGQRGLSASSCFGEEICFSSEKELGFWKPKTMHYYQGEHPYYHVLLFPSFSLTYFPFLSAHRRHPVNCILQAHINHASLLLEYVTPNWACVTNRVV
ncbi:hypothetical protein CsSME_00052861 [Camellia sinensis var. sinensis]